MELVDIMPDNIANEHICCAITDKKGETCVSSKKAWMTERFADGLVFKRLDARGKVFIEYMPAEKAWYPIDAANCMCINCFWVSGQYKGRGYANALLDACIADAKAQGKRGIVALSSAKKMPFLTDPGYLKYKGFEAVDTAAPYYELLYLPLGEDAPPPAFRECAKQGKIDEKGMALYYTNQCPHTDKYVPLIAGIAAQRGARVSVHKIETLEQAKNAPSPFTTYSFFYDGDFLTNEIFSEKKFNKFLDEKGL